MVHRRVPAHALAIIRSRIVTPISKSETRPTSPPNASRDHRARHATATYGEERNRMSINDITERMQTAASKRDHRWLALAIIGVAQLMIILDASIVTIALPDAAKDLGISDADRQWVMTAYTLAFGGLLLLGGRIADYYGRKRTFLIGLLGFAGASALGGFAQTSGQLFAARALQGAFAALLAPAVLSLFTTTCAE